MYTLNIEVDYMDRTKIYFDKYVLDACALNRPFDTFDFIGRFPVQRFPV